MLKIFLYVQLNQDEILNSGSVNYNPQIPPLKIDLIDFRHYIGFIKNYSFKWAIRGEAH